MEDQSDSPLFSILQQAQDILVARGIFLRSRLDTGTGKGSVTWTPEGLQLKSLLHELLCDEEHPKGTEDPMRILMVISSILETSAKKKHPSGE